MSTLDMSDEIENIEPNITVNVEPVDEPAAEPVAEPVVEPAVEPVAEPVDEPEVEPEVVAEPAVEPVADEVVEPVADKVDDFEEYLKSIGLEKFTNKFKENGYDSVESLKKINISDIKNISKNCNQLRYINRKLRHLFN